MSTSYNDAVAHLSRCEDIDLNEMDSRQIMAVFYALQRIRLQVDEDDEAAAIYGDWMRRVTGDDPPTDLPGSYRKWMHRKAGRDFPIDLPNPDLPDFRVPDFPPNDGLES